MKRLGSILLAVLLLLTGCGKEAPEETRKAEMDTTPAAEVATTEAVKEVNMGILLETSLPGVDYGLTAVNPYGSFSEEDVTINSQGAEALIKWLLGQPQLDAIGDDLFTASEAASVYNGWIANAAENTKRVRLLTTVDLQECGILEDILPQFTEDYGYEVEVIGAKDPYAEAVTGAGDMVLAQLPNGDFYKESGYFRQIPGIQALHIPLMTCPYVLCGPEADPAGAGKCGSLEEALKAIEKAQCYFVHWTQDPFWEEEPTGDWYFPVNTEVGPALTIAEELGGYVICDKLTYEIFRSLKGIIS